MAQIEFDFILDGEWYYCQSSFLKTRHIDFKNVEFSSLWIDSMSHNIGHGYATYQLQVILESAEKLTKYTCSI